MLGHHFTGDKLRNGAPIPPIGEWLAYAGQIEPCMSGLHASEHPFDALMYAPGSMLHRVELEGDMRAHGSPPDKWVGRRRRILATIDATALLRAFGRWCASNVLYLWDAPQVVRDYLATGDESLREAARAAALESAQEAACAAARATASEASWATARATAEDAAWATAWQAARATDRAIAGEAAWATAWGAAWITERGSQRLQFAAIVDAAFGA